MAMFRVPICWAFSRLANGKVATLVPRRHVGFSRSASVGRLKLQEGVACCIVCFLCRCALQEQEVGKAVTSGWVC